DSTRPTAAISEAVVSTPSCFLSAQITVAPSAASASAAALPMPDAAPRTSAILPSRRNRFRYVSSRSSIPVILDPTIPHFNRSDLVQPFAAVFALSLSARGEIHSSGNTVIGMMQRNRGDNQGLPPQSHI